MGSSCHIPSIIPVQQLDTTALLLVCSLCYVNSVHITVDGTPLPPGKRINEEVLCSYARIHVRRGRSAAVGGHSVLPEGLLGL
jgi:hypothetical protein